MESSEWAMWECLMSKVRWTVFVALAAVSGLLVGVGDRLRTVGRTCRDSSQWPSACARDCEGQGGARESGHAD